MAIEKCRECGKEVSTNAKTCPNCGAKKPAQPGILLSLFVIGVGIFLIYVFVSAILSGGGDAGTSGQQCKPDDLTCLGNKYIANASVYCKRPVEKLALHDVKWTDGALDLKFSRFRWAPEGNGAITFIGDKAEFQNGFGAYTPVIYGCDVADDGRTVLNAYIIGEGRLPE